MKLNVKTYAAVHDGAILGHYEGYIIGGSIEEVREELDAWSGCCFQGLTGIEIVPVIVKLVDEPAIPWTDEEAEIRRAENAKRAEEIMKELNP